MSRTFKCDCPGYFWWCSSGNPDNLGPSMNQRGTTDARRCPRHAPPCSKRPGGRSGESDTFPIRPLPTLRPGNAHDRTINRSPGRWPVDRVVPGSQGVLTFGPKDLDTALRGRSAAHIRRVCCAARGPAPCLKAFGARMSTRPDPRPFRKTSFPPSPAESGIQSSEMTPRLSGFPLPRERHLKAAHPRLGVL